jgi:hypothetical protein
MKHALTIRSFSTVWDTDGIEVTCSCGQQNRVTEGADEPPDYESHGSISLAELNRLEAAHASGMTLRELAAGAKA